MTLKAVADGRKNRPNDEKRGSLGPTRERSGTTTSAGILTAPFCPKCQTTPTKVQTIHRPRVLTCHCTPCNHAIVVFYGVDNNLARMFREERVPKDFKGGLLRYARTQLSNEVAATYGFPPLT